MTITPMNSTEMIQWLMDGLKDDRFQKVFDGGKKGDIFSILKNYTATEIAYKAELYRRITDKSNIF